MSTAWWYGSSGERIGPLDAEGLKAALKARKLTETTLVWREGMAEWKPLASVDELAALRLAVPPELPQQSDREVAPSLPLARPWRRFFARTIDLWLLSLAVGAVVGYIGSRLSMSFGLWLMKPQSDFLFSWMLLPFVLVAEAAIFGLAGNTIGKALLGVKVTTIAGDRPTFAQYLRRLAGVYWYGLGTGFPLVSLFTMSRQARHVGDQRHAIYDRGNFNVKAGRLGVARVTGAVTIIVLSLVINGGLRQTANERSRDLIAGSNWTNEVTGQVVQIPAGWLHQREKNEEGSAIEVFASPNQGVIIVFAKEDTNGGLSLDAYVRLWCQAVASEMTVNSNGVHTMMNGLDAWQGQGHMASDLTQRVHVSIMQRGRQMWRIVVVRGKQTVVDEGAVDKVRSALASTLVQEL
jgi:uncharacterized RDD family membrane protein YckC